jgi:hypothetical protein
LIWKVLMSISLISAFLLFASGLSITIAGAFFSVKGVVMLIPDPEIYYGLLVLAVAFEGAKITASTFLFHEYRDSQYPTALKVILSTAVAALVLLSSIATYSHLNASISKSMSTVTSNSAERTRLTEDRDQLQQTIRNIETQMNSLPPNTGANARIRMMKAFEGEKAEAKARLDSVSEKIQQLDQKNVEEDKFLFLNSLSALTGLNRDKLYTVIVLSIVALIDPLAITLILSGSFIVANIRKEKDVIAEQQKEIEILKEEEQALEETLEETTEQLIERIEESIEEHGGNITKEDVEALLKIEQSADSIPARSRKKLIKIRDFLKGSNDNPK